MTMRSLKILFLLAGLALTALILVRTDLPQVAGLLAQVGVLGFAAVLVVYFAGFVIDAASWQLTIPTAGLGLGWLKTLYNVRLAGEAFNSVTPAAGMGGEPVKAVLLKHYFGVGYREGVASLVMAKTVNMIALVAFLAAGFALMLSAEIFSPTHKLIAGIGLAAFAAGTAMFFGIQRFRLTSLTGARLGNHPRIQRLFKRIEEGLAHLQDVDARFVAFYARSRGRFASALALAFANWILGAVEVWLVMALIGREVSFADAWIIETVAQLVRAGTFFIPASIGAQEGMFLLMGSLVTGSAAPGIALAAVRRAREIVWILWGMAVFHRLKPVIEEEEGRAA